LLPERDVDAGVGGIDPAAQEEVGARAAGGFAEIRNDKVIILADTAERPEEIDRPRAERAKERAERRLSGRTQEEVDYARCQAALARALTRLSLK